MGDRMVCPACEADLWSVLQAFRQGEPCPQCGLPAQSTAEILEIRKRGADEALERKYTEAMRRALDAERENLSLRAALRRIGETVAGLGL